MRDLELKQVNVMATVSRMMLALGVKNLAELSRALGYGPRTANNWGKRGGVPLEALHRCHKITGRSLDWLYTGVENENSDMQSKLDDYEAATLQLLMISEYENKIVVTDGPKALTELAKQLKNIASDIFDNDISCDGVKKTSNDKA